MIAFNLNEKLKEDLILNYQAKRAETTHYPNGMMFIPERFFETMVYWDSKVEEQVIENALDVIEKSKKDLEPYCYFDGPMVQNENKKIIIIWALFDKQVLDDKGVLKDYLQI